jgi:hypothetical protein
MSNLHSGLQSGRLVHLRTPRLKARFGSTAVILRCDGESATLFTDAGKATVKRQDFSIPAKPAADCLPMRLRLPFGDWEEEDGSRVLFSRDFCPLWRIGPGETITPDMPWRPAGRQRENRYWDFRTAPWCDRTTELRMEALLQKIGITSDPILGDALFLMIRNPDLSIREAVTEMGRKVTEPM